MGEPQPPRLLSPTTLPPPLWFSPWEGGLLGVPETWVPPAVLRTWTLGKVPPALRPPGLGSLGLFPPPNSSELPRVHQATLVGEGLLEVSL